MGADYYEVCYTVSDQIHFIWLNQDPFLKIRYVILIFWLQTDADRTLLAAKGSIPIGIGRDSHIKRAIIDKNARIGDNVKVIFILTTCYQLHCPLFQLSRRLTVLISSTLCVYSDHQHGQCARSCQRDGWILHQERHCYSDQGCSDS